MSKLNNKGFAVSSVLYPVLILTIFLIVQILTMMASRKSVLDRNKTALLDSVNASNKVYNNEELSILVAEQQEKINILEDKLAQNETNDAKLSQKQQTDYNQLLKIITKNQHMNIKLANDLDVLTDYDNATVYFTPNTIGRPPYYDCTYGIVQNFSVGSSSTVESESYWTFQLAFCTEKNQIYTRKRINSSSKDAWSAWSEH